MRPLTPRRFPAHVVALLSVALLAACTADSTDEPAGGSATPAASSSTQVATLAVVDPTTVEGLTSTVHENLDKGHYTYLTFPVIPGAAELTEAMRAGLQPQVERFEELATPADEAPYPELQVSWDLVAASPQAIGVRLVTAEVADDDTFQGKAQTTWWDPATRMVRVARDLIAEDASAAFFERLTQSALATPGVEEQRFRDQLDGEWEAFDSIAFTPEGDLWVEFDRRQVSDIDEPVGIRVAPTGLLSDFGALARAAALTPADPGLRDPATPSTQPSQSAPTPEDPAATSPAGSSASAASRVVDCAEVRCAALTFDDGPVAETVELLDMLRDKGVPATFFTVGSNVANHPEILKRMVAEGHVVGNHTYDHPQLTRLGEAAIRKEITRTNALIEKATGRRPTLLRPPYGATNASVRAVAADLGMAQVMWNVDPEDWKDRNSAIVTRRVLANTRNGSIVLSHDIHATTRAAYARIIDGLRERGFTLVTVPELFGGQMSPGKSYFGR